MTIDVNRQRMSCDKMVEGGKSCRRSISMKAIENEYRRADGWRAIMAGEDHSHSTSHLCPLHGLELDDWLNEEEVEQSVRRRVRA